MEQKIIVIEATCSSTIEQQRDKKIKEMNERGYKLISISTIPGTSSPIDTHGVSYSKNEKKELLFEKL